MTQPRRGERDWNPAYPDFAVGADQGLYDDHSESGKPYERSPPTSHVYGWKILTGGFVRKFYANAAGAPAGTVAVLMVAFKPNPPKGSKVNPDTIQSEYEYFFTDNGEAFDWLTRFRNAVHPGHVVQDLIKQRVPYNRKS